jgi:hypothetical protein
MSNSANTNSKPDRPGPTFKSEGRRGSGSNVAAYSADANFPSTSDTPRLAQDRAWMKLREGEGASGPGQGTRREQRSSRHGPLAPSTARPGKKRKGGRGQRGKEGREEIPNEIVEEIASYCRVSECMRVVASEAFVRFVPWPA